MASVSGPYAPRRCPVGWRNKYAIAVSDTTNKRYATAMVGDPAAFTAAVVAAVKAEAPRQNISKAAGAQTTSAPRCIDSSPGVFRASDVPVGREHKDDGPNTLWRSGAC
jgi:hypothetical protein